MRLRPIPAAAMALLAAASLSLSGCTSDDEPAADGPTTTAAAPAGNDSPDPSSGTATGPSPTGTPTETEGDGDGEGDDTPATAGGGICGDLSADEVGAVLGGTAKGAALPGGGCAFTQPAAKAPFATFVEKTPGGIEGAKTEATSSVEGEPQDLPGIGDAAFVVTGTAFGEPAIQGAGAVQVGKRIINVNLTQASGMSAAAVKSMTVKLLRLAGAQAG